MQGITVAPETMSARAAVICLMVYTVFGITASSEIMSPQAAVTCTMFYKV